MIYRKGHSKNPRWWMGHAYDDVWVAMPFNLVFRFFTWMRNG